MFEDCIGNSDANKLAIVDRVLSVRAQECQLDGFYNDSQEACTMAIKKLVAPVNISSSETLSYDECVVLYATNDKTMPDFNLHSNITKYKIPFKYNQAVDHLNNALSANAFCARYTEISAPPITIHPKDEFFIAVGTQKNYHSFVMLGVMQHQKPILLARIGKMARKKWSPTITNQLRACVFLSQKDVMEFQEEKLELDGDISYSATAISYDDYVEFTRLTGFLQSDRKIFCYRPVQTNDEFVVLKKSSVPKETLTPPQSCVQQEILHRSHQFNFYSNTCRNSAIDLLEYIQKCRSNISQLFWTNLRAKAYFKAGETQQPFYVFPKPPTLCVTTPEQKRMLEKIYNRMEALIQKAPEDKQTIEKFEALKKLYQAQAGIESGHFNDVLQSIIEWKATHHDAISVLRQQSLFGKLLTKTSSTLAMANELEFMSKSLLTNHF